MESEGLGAATDSGRGVGDSRELAWVVSPDHSGADSSFDTAVSV